MDSQLRTRFRYVLAGLLLSSALLAPAACSDNTGPGDALPFDAPAIAASLEEILGVLEFERSMLDAFGTALRAMERYPGGIGLPVLPDALAVQGYPFLANNAGTTFEFDPETQSYVPGQDPSEAPPDGIRFLIYAVDPFAHTPSVPLAVVGHLDLTDRSGDEMLRLGVHLASRAEGEPRILAEYEIREVDGAANVTASGSLGPGGELEIDLADAMEIESGFAHWRAEQMFRFAGPNAALEVSFEAVSESDTDFLPDESTRETWFATDDRILALLTHLDRGHLQGEVEFDGQPVALISGTTLNPVFTGLDGSPLATAEVQALGRIYDAGKYAEVLGTWLLRPGGIRALRMDLSTSTAARPGRFSGSRRKRGGGLLLAVSGLANAPST